MNYGRELTGRAQRYLRSLMPPDPLAIALQAYMRPSSDAQKLAELIVLLEQFPSAPGLRSFVASFIEKTQVKLSARQAIALFGAGLDRDDRNLFLKYRLPRSGEEGPQLGAQLLARWEADKQDVEALYDVLAVFDVLRAQNQQTAQMQAPGVQKIMQHMVQMRLDLGRDIYPAERFIAQDFMAFHVPVDRGIFEDFFAMVRDHDRLRPYRREAASVQDLIAIYALAEQLAAERRWSDAAFVYRRGEACFRPDTQVADLCFMAFIRLYAAHACIRREHEGAIVEWSSTLHDDEQDARPYPSRYVAGRLLWDAGLRHDVLSCLSKKGFFRSGDAFRDVAAVLERFQRYNPTQAHAVVYWAASALPEAVDAATQAAIEGARDIQRDMAKHLQQRARSRHDIRVYYGISDGRHREAIDQIDLSIDHVGSHLDAKGPKGRLRALFARRA